MDVIPTYKFNMDKTKEALEWLEFIFKNARWGEGALTSAKVEELANFMEWRKKHFMKLANHMKSMQAVLKTELTFTEAEVKLAGHYLTWMFNAARWGEGYATSQLCQNVGRLLNWCHLHVKMMNEHVMELVSYTESEEGKLQREEENNVSV